MTQPADRRLLTEAAGNATYAPVGDYAERGDVADLTSDKLDKAEAAATYVTQTGVSGVVEPMVPPLVAQAIADDDTPALAAAAAVEDAAAGLDLVLGSDPRIPEHRYVEGVLAAITDADGKRTWLEARDSDGGPTELAVSRVADRLGMSREDAYGVLFAVADSGDNLTDLTVRAVDGQVPDWVIDRWATRIQDRLDTPTSGLQFSPHDTYLRDGEVLPVFTSGNWSGWGSSGMEHLHYYLSPFLPGFHGGGKAGEWTTHIAARMGAIPMLVTVTGGTIPASGAVAVTSSNNLPNSNAMDFTGTLNGVAGTMGITGGEWEFTRAATGDPVTVEPDTPFLPDVGPTRRADAMIFYMGKNDINAAVPGSHTQIADNTAACFDWQSAFVKRILVMGHFVNGTMPPEHIQHTLVRDVNRLYVQRYGDQYLDVQTFFTTNLIWEYTGLTPTTADLDAQAAGTLPPSIWFNEQDWTHLNAVGNQALADYIRDKLVALNWIEGA